MFDLPEQNFEVFASAFLVAGIFYLLGVGTTYLFARWQRREQRKLVTEQGSLRKPSLAGSLIADGLYEEAILAAQLTKGRPAVLSLPVIVYNRGDKAAVGVTAFVRTPRIMRFPGDFHIVEKAVAEIFGLKVAVHDSDDNFTFILSWPKVAAKSEMRTFLPVILPGATTFDLEIPVKKKGVEHAKIAISARVTLPVSVMISDEDGQVVSFSHRLEVLKGSRLEVVKFLDAESTEAIAKPSAKVRESRWLQFKHGWVVPRPSTMSKFHVIILPPPKPFRGDAAIDYFEFPGGTAAEGVEDKGAYYVPALGTSFFGEPDPLQHDRTGRVGDN